MRTPLPLLLLCACSDGVPVPCPTMCTAAAPLQAACLAEDELDWSATDWGDAQGFVESCETWAWEQRRLERDARRRGEIDGSGHTAAACEARLASFEDPAANCDTYEAIDWDAPVWEAP